MKTNMIIGLTGGSGSGKSTIARLLGGVVITSDEVYHELLSNNEKLRLELINRFGTCERAQLRKKVFGDDKMLMDLETITHKYIVKGIKDKLITLKNEKLVIIDAAIVLIKTNLGEVCDKVVAVLADKAVRVYRIMARDGLTAAEVEARINAQPSDEVYLDKSMGVVYNNGDIKKAVRGVKKIIKR